MIQYTKNSGGGGNTFAPDLLVEQHRGSLMTALEGSGLSKAQCQLVTVLATTWGREMARDALMQGGSSTSRGTAQTKQAGASSESPQKRAARTRAANRSKPDELVKDVMAAASKSTTPRKSRGRGKSDGNAHRAQAQQPEAAGSIAA